MFFSVFGKLFVSRGDPHFLPGRAGSLERLRSRRQQLRP